MGTWGSEGEAMRFDIYGRYRLDVVREDGRWALYRLDGGKRRAVTDFAIPNVLQTEELETYLDDMLHELARPGDVVRCID